MVIRHVFVNGHGMPTQVMGFSQMAIPEALVLSGRRRGCVCIYCRHVRTSGNRWFGMVTAQCGLLNALSESSLATHEIAWVH